MSRIFCIAAGQLLLKKEDHQIQRRNLYLNYGLLSIATMLYDDGWDPIQIQGNFDPPAITLKKCINYDFNNSFAPMLISVPSFYAVSWTNEFMRLVKNLKPDIKIIIGGRWVIDGQIDQMANLLPLSDLIFPGLADFSICKIVDSFYPYPKQIRSKHVVRDLTSLNYSLLTERFKYQPSIEVSRGCGMGCNFCQEKDEQLLPLKEPLLIIQEAQKAILYDELRTMNLYFEASMFIPDLVWIEKLINMRENNKLDFQWRTEGRVDNFNPKYMKKLKQAGLRVIDIGLESASPIQLIRMNKTKNAEKYLKKASDLFSAAYDAEIAVKVNVLLTAGETIQSIEETINWLDRHKKTITGVSVGPVIVFGWPYRIKEYLDDLYKYGATVSHSPVLGITHLNLSKEINFEKSMEISNEIGCRYMNADDYFFLKSFSYYSRDYTYENFKADILSSENDYGFDVSCILNHCTT